VILNRRDFLGLAAQTGVSLAADPMAVRAIAFDAFPIFDPRPVFALAEELYPGRGAELSNLWRTRQFEYTWLRTMSRNYADFWQVTGDALVFAAKSLRLDLLAANRSALLDTYLKLHCWPDVPDVLRARKSAGMRLAFLSNMTPAMLQAGIRNSQLEGIFDHVLSTDAVKAYKPDPRAYQMGLDAFGLRREQILFAAFAGWDAAGAKSFGYPTFWVNRQNQPAEELDVMADGVGTTLSDLATFLTGTRQKTKTGCSHSHLLWKEAEN
jgi:2-haloacid dehalogenase